MEGPSQRATRRAARSAQLTHELSNRELYGHTARHTDTAVTVGGPEHGAGGEQDPIQRLAGSPGELKPYHSR